MKLAIVDDNKLEQELIFNTLRTYEHERNISLDISSYSDGNSFLNTYVPGDFDLIFMDIYMEGMTGIDAVTAIRKIDSHVPVAFATTSTEFALESYRLDALKYIEKPVQKKAVMELLELARFKKEQIPSLLLQISGKDPCIRR